MIATSQFERTGFKDDVFKYLASIVFMGFWVATFFGLTSPFEDVQDPSDISSSSVLNQIVYSSLYLLALVCLIPIHEKILGIIRREKNILRFSIVVPVVGLLVGFYLHFV